MIFYECLPTVEDMQPDQPYAVLSIYLELEKYFAMRKTAEEIANDSPYRYTGFQPMETVEFIEGQPKLMPGAIPSLTTVRILTSAKNPDNNAYRINYVFESLEKLIAYALGTEEEFTKAKVRWAGSKYNAAMKENRKWINGVPYDEFLKSYKKTSSI